MRCLAKQVHTAARHVSKGGGKTSDAPVLNPSPTDEDLITSPSEDSLGDPDNVRDVRGLVSSWAGEGSTLVHSGGALPSLFPEKPREGSCRIIRYLGWKHVPPERAGNNEVGATGFLVITGDVLHPETGAVVARAQMTMGATLEEYFGFRQIIEGEGKSRVVVGLECTRAPEDTPPLLITFAGFGKGKPGLNAPKMWIIEEIRPAVATVKGNVRRA